MDQFDCAVCYELIKNCYMTPCGHNFCKHCISECLNRKHICPLCNADTVFEQCHPNIQFDNILRIVQQEKETASKKYFEKLFTRSKDKQPGGGVEGPASGAAEGGEKRAAAKFSPVESLFQKHMRKSLAEFNAYLATLNEKKDLSLQQIRDVYIDKMGKAKSGVEAKYPRGEAPRKAVDDALLPLEKDMNAEVAKVEESFDQSVSLMLEAFDKVREMLLLSFVFLFFYGFVLAFGKGHSVYFSATSVGCSGD